MGIKAIRIGCTKKRTSPEKLETKRASYQVKKANGTIVSLTTDQFETISKVASITNVLPYDLMAICLQESGCNDQAIGDNGAAIGAFQINVLYHRGEEEAAKNFEYSAKWTAKRMIRLGYNKDDVNSRYYAIWNHNGVVRGVNEYYPEIVMEYSRQLEPYFTLI